MKIKTRNINDCVKRITIEGNTTIHILINNSEDIKCIEFFGDTTSIIFKRNHFSILNNIDIQKLDDKKINHLYLERLKEVKEINIKNTIKIKKSNYLNTTAFYIEDFKNDLSLHIEEVSGIIKINLDGECNLKINNFEIKGNLQHIKDNYPQDFFNVIRKYEDYINLSKYNEFEIDVRLNNTSLVTLYFPKDINKETSDITLRYDTAKTESQLNQVNIDKQTKTEILSSYKKLTKKLSDLGYKLYYSHDQSEVLWGWSDVIIPSNNINEKLIKEISDTFYNHQKEVECIEKKLNI